MDERVKELDALFEKYAKDWNVQPFYQAWRTWLRAAAIAGLGSGAQAWDAEVVEARKLARSVLNRDAHSYDSVDEQLARALLKATNR